MPAFTTYGTYATKTGRMQKFCFDLTSTDLTAASEAARLQIQARKAYAGKLSYSVFEIPIRVSSTPTIDGSIRLEDIHIPSVE